MVNVDAERLHSRPTLSAGRLVRASAESSLPRAARAGDGIVKSIVVMAGSDTAAGEAIIGDGILTGR
jgi:hypothetical protein